MMGMHKKEAIMNLSSQQAQAELALGVERQHRELVQLAQTSRLSLAYVNALIFPVALLAFAFLEKSLSFSEKMIAFGAAFGLLSVISLFELELNRRTRVLIRLLERGASDTR
jgi:positive regulator of sigma E activity